MLSAFEALVTALRAIFEERTQGRLPQRSLRYGERGLLWKDRLPHS